MKGNGSQNPYLPYPVRIETIMIENADKDLKTFKLVFLNKEDEEAFQYLPGQFAELSVFGKGESPIGIASSPTEKGYLLFTVKKVGVLTSDLHNSEEGRVIGVRGPLGKPYPLDVMEGKNVIIIGGGFAFTTLRSTIRYILAPENRSRFQKVITIYGARSPGELIYKEELKELQARDDIEMYVTVDKGDESWTGKEGFVPTVLKEVSPSSENAIALVCGPPIMLKFTLPVLSELGFSPEMIVVSLEMRMKCGIGKCGRCNIGNVYVCKDGPVFTYKQLQALRRRVLSCPTGGQWEIPLISLLELSRGSRGVPEGLRIVPTLVPARGVWRMARRDVLINRLPAVETPVATNVIRTDKTSTLTEPPCRRVDWPGLRFRTD